MKDCSDCAAREAEDDGGRCGILLLVAVLMPMFWMTKELQAAGRMPWSPAWLTILFLLAGLLLGALGRMVATRRARVRRGVTKEG